MGHMAWWGHHFNRNFHEAFCWQKQKQKRVTVCVCLCTCTSRSRLSWPLACASLSLSSCFLFVSQNPHEPRTPHPPSAASRFAAPVCCLPLARTILILLSFLLLLFFLLVLVVDLEL